MMSAGRLGYWSSFRSRRSTARRVWLSQFPSDLPRVLEVVQRVFHLRGTKSV